MAQLLADQNSGDTQRSQSAKTHRPALQRGTVLHRLLPKIPEAKVQPQGDIQRRTAHHSTPRQPRQRIFPRTGIQTPRHRPGLRPAHTQSRRKHPPGNLETLQEHMARRGRVQPPRHQQRKLILLGNRRERHPVCRPQLPHPPPVQRPPHRRLLTAPSPQKRTACLWHALYSHHYK